MPLSTAFWRNLAYWLLAALPVALVGALCLFWHWTEPDPGWDLWDQMVWWGVAFLAAALGAVVVAWLWQRRLRRRIEGMIQQYQSAALGQPFRAGRRLSYPDPLDRLDRSVQSYYSALGERLLLYRRFFEAAGDMFITFIAAGGRITEANRSFCRAVGKLPSEVIGQPVGRFITLGMDWDLVAQRPGELLTGTINTELGQVRVEASLSVESEPENQLWVMGMILRDIDQRESLHHALLAKSAALEQALREVRSVEKMKDQFLTTLSHELKTPLVSLKGFLQLIMSGKATPEQHSEYLAICARNLAKLEKQINNLLDLARLTHAKDQYQLGPVDLAVLVHTEAENLAALAAEYKVTLNLEQVGRQPALVRGNPEKLVQLVDNLLMNAVKYNVEGGEVRVSLVPDERNLVLSVSDSGVGMDREEMAKIFNYFYRAEMGGTGRLEGLGIGLSLVQEIVRLHRGDIKVRSRPGQGTTFTVVLARA